MSRVEPSTDALPNGARRRLKEILERFEEAWQSGQRPSIDAYLPAEPAERLQVLTGLAQIELECRLKTGEPARVEEYLSRYPQLAENPPAALELVTREYLLRQRCEPELSPEEYRQRFPQYASELVARLQRRGDGTATEVPTASILADDSRPGAVAPTQALPGETGSIRSAWPTLPGYEILEEIGRGGMGRVYKARQIKLNRLVAVKMILAGRYATPDEMARFRREAETVARLQHAHVIQIIDMGEHDGEAFVVFEYVEGGTLAQKLNGKPLPAAEAAKLVEILARAVGAAHRRGILHRDLKPGNILLTADGMPKITDFGLAKCLDAASQRTPSGAILGTAGYLAPEQADGQGRQVGPAADIYALGAILYELLTGRPPFRGPTPLETVLQAISKAPVPPAKVQPGIPRNLELICLKCLEKEPADRYATAEELADDLHSWPTLGHLPPRAPMRHRKVGKLIGHFTNQIGLVAALLITALALLLASLFVRTTSRNGGRHAGLVEGQADVAAEIVVPGRHSEHSRPPEMGTRPKRPEIEKQRAELVKILASRAKETMHERKRAIQAQANVPAGARRVALLVGINSYDNRNFPDLLYAERDMQELASLLRQDYQVHMLLGTGAYGQRATKHNIERALNELLRSGLSKDDTVLIAVVGHGQQFAVQRDGSRRDEVFFCARDSVSGDAATMVNLSGLIERLAERGGGTNLLLIDACRADPDSTRGPGIDGDPVLNLPRGMALFFSCSKGERAEESTKAGGGHGLFFHFVLEALRNEGIRNANRELTWSALVFHVKERMEAEAPMLLGPGVMQTPRELANLGRSPVVLGHRSIGVNPDPMEPPAVKAPTSPVPVTTTSLRELREGMKSLAREILNKTENQPVAIGQFAAAGLPHSNAGVGLEEGLKEALESLQLGSVRTSAGFEVKGDYFLVPSRTTPDFKEIKLITRIIQPDGGEVDRLRSEIRFDATYTLAELIGITGSLSPSGTKAERNGQIQELQKHPSVYIHGGGNTLVSASKDSPYAVELLVRPIDGKNDPKPCQVRDADGFAYVDITKTELYQLKIYNDSGKPVTVTISIDGLDMFHFMKERAPDGQRRFQRFIVDRSNATIGGWPITLQEVSPFVVTEYGPTEVNRARNGVVNRSGFMSRNQIGVIHVQFADAILLPPGARPRGGSETGFGPPVAANVRPIQYDIQPPHDFVTIRYNR
jgi:serine/threonine protein kinase